MFEKVKKAFKPPKDPMESLKEGYRLDCINWEAHCSHGFDTCEGCAFKPKEKSAGNRFIGWISEALIPGSTLKPNKHYPGSLFRTSPMVLMMIHFVNIFVLIFGTLWITGVDIYMVDVGEPSLADDEPITFNSDFKGILCYIWVGLYYSPKGWLDKQFYKLGKKLKRNKND